MAEREARLKDEFTLRYPSLSPTTWYPAGQLIEVVAQVRGEELSAEVAARLPDEHFEFRGGDAPRGSNHHTRRADGSEPGG